MRKILLLLLIFPIFISAQINDDFTDGDFTSNPTWTGDVSQFEVNSSNQLHLNSIGADTSSLSTTNSLISNTEWQFWVKLSFQTSGNNNARVYLTSNNANIEGSLNGYFVQIGETNDSIALFRQDGTLSTKIISGTVAYTNNSTNTLRIKVTRDNTGLWNLFSDPLGGNNFLLEGTTTDNTYSTSSFFGVFCKYTTSNSTKFYFDDFVVGAITVDTIPPDISKLSVVSSIELDIEFTESLNKTIAENVNNYIVNNGIGKPALAILDANNTALVHLTFANSFALGVQNTITISNIEDLKGNISPVFNEAFIYYIPETFDILINEIMADPDPPAGLPNYEYLELYNRTSISINLKDWTLRIGISDKILPDVIIQGNSYLILAKDDAEPYLSPFGDIITFSSFSLTNAGQTITLFNQSGQMISSVSYTDDWYQNSLKKDGGWSLEQIDPLNPCGEKENWKASVHSVGGTPGSVNSVNAINPDITAPKISRVVVFDATNIKVVFNEKLDSSYLQNNSNYFIDNNIGNPIGATIKSPDFMYVILELANPLQPGVIYSLLIKDTIKDCVGNIIQLNSSIPFAIPAPVEAFDIVINEVLSNPKDDGVDFVEIYNRSNKVLDLKEMILSSYDTIALTIEDPEDISMEGYLIFPGEYYVLTTKPDKVKQQYFTSNPDGFVEMNSFPTYNNDFGIVVIADKIGRIIDKFTYNEEMHFALLNSTDGVSLERLSYERPTEDKTNWHSAAEAVGFATPAYQNSQLSLSNITGDEIKTEPEIFSPDNDGYNDVLNINYKFDKAGYVANITIYDSKGRLIKYLIKNELLATEGTFSWDGITEENEKANIGIYIIYVEVFDLEGKVKHFKKTAVLGGKL
ncbi:MAG: lamin tail domain-containing protein [Saprospiraceae bacterium]|nr:lamin tail domain-containing protein [Saprospiraceae bacterium]